MNILVLGGKGKTTYAVVNALAKHYKDISLILENDVPAVTFFRKRIRRLGLPVVLGQIIFMVTVPWYLKKKSKKRIDEILQQHGIETVLDYERNVHCYSVNSINDEETIKIIVNCNPDIVIVNGTRIISKHVLESVQAPIINMHMGITPKYRGVHGAYWALVNDDAENCGVTVHMVNQGIDTGDVIRQKRITVKREDNFVTYPYIQAGEGIKLEIEVLKEYEKTRKIATQKVDLPSMIWSHPTIWQYIKNRGKSR